MNKTYSQTIIKEIIKDNNFIINKTKVNFSDYYNKFKYDDNEPEEHEIDKKTYEEFKALIKNYSIKNTTWNKRELESNIYFVDINKRYLEIDSVKFYLNKTNEDKQLTKEFISKVRNYNSDVIEWRHFPLCIQI